MNKNLLIYLIAAVAATGGLLFGFDTGIINVALTSLRTDFTFENDQESWVVTAVLIGAMFGPFLAGYLSDLLGRKKINVIAAFVFVMGTMVAAMASSVAMLFTGRLLLGFAIGIVAATVPLYLAELSPKEKRGSFVTYFQLAITLGILLSYLIGYVFDGDLHAWRPMFWAGILPAFLLLLGMFLSPESPRWLLSKGREAEARQILIRLRGSEELADAEIAETNANILNDRKNTASWTELFAKKLRLPLMIGVCIFFIQQFSGINAIIYYSKDIFNELFSNSQATLATVGVGLVNTAATILGMRYLDKWGRKPLLYTGLIGTAVCLATVGFAFYFKESLPTSISQTMLVGGIYSYIVFFAISLGPLGWLLISEIYPLRIRGFATSMGSFNHWVFDAMVAYSFPIMQVSILGKNGGIFFIYMSVVLLGLFFAKYMVFETKGLSLEDIEKKYEK